MRIHRLHLQDYRGIADAEITFPTEGVTIIEGPNEVGKTSVAEALHLVFDYADSSRSVAVKALQPVSRDAGPRVEIEVTTGAYHFVYTKQWLRKPSTTLTLLTPTRAQLNGREAHDRVNEILDETVDRVLWEALRLRQGQDLSLQPGFSMPSLRRVLESTVGAQSTTDRDDDLWTRIVAEKDKYWMANGRPSHERARSLNRVAEANEAVSQAEAAIAHVERLAAELVGLQIDAVRLEDAHRELTEVEAELLTQAEAVLALNNTLEQADATAKLAEASFDQASSRLSSRQALVAAVKQCLAEVELAEARLAEADPARAAAEEALSAARAARASAAEEHRRAEQVAHQASQASTYRRKQIELEQFTERRDRALQARADLAAAETVLAAPPVAATAVVEVEQAHLEVARAEAVASAGAATIDAWAEVATRIEVDGQVIELAAGTSLTVPVAQRSDVGVPGLVRFTVTAGADADAHAEKLAVARQQLERLCERLGVADLGEARRVSLGQVDAERCRDAASLALAESLRDLSMEELEGKIQRQTAWLAAFESQRATGVDLPATFEQARLLEAEAHEHFLRCRDVLADLDAKVEAAIGETRDADVAAAVLSTQATMKRAALEDAEQRLATQRQARPDQLLEDELQAARATRDLATAEHAQALIRLEEADPDTVGALTENARKARERGQTAIRINHDRQLELRTLVDNDGEKGLAHRRDLAIGEADRLRIESERLELRAEAALLLFQTFDQRRAQARAKFVAPFRAKIESLGRLVFGTGFEVQLDEDLRIESRTLDGDTVGFDSLSSGTREQLALISRLACAELVATGGEGAPVVFDDALGWADPQRLKQMAAMIGVASTRSQVIVLTCTPGRFAGIGNATVVPLTNQASEPSSANSA